MTTAEGDLQALEAMFGELEPYLLSSELFYPLDSPHRLAPSERLTLGNLLLRLDGLQVTVHGEALSGKWELRWEAAKNKWMSAMVNKASLEIDSRLNLWRAYLTDLEEGRGDKFDFAREVRNRVIIERLFDLDLDQTRWTAMLQAFDHQLRKLVEPTGFLWAPGLAERYPKPRYWYLYAAPRATA